MKKSSFYWLTIFPDRIHSDEHDLCSEENIRNINDKSFMVKRNTGLSDTILRVNTIAMFVFLIPLVAAIFFNGSKSLLCISIFLILIEIEFLFLGFITIWKLLILLKRSIMNQQIKLSYFLVFLAFILIGGYVAMFSISNIYQEIDTVLKDYRVGGFTYYYKGKFPGWITYNRETDSSEFTAEIILRYFSAGLWGFLLELGILMITSAFVIFVRPTLRKFKSVND
ncbi:hypothetical protein [Chryseobacterium flavum]|uniref:hypothetical protein n=2 Tax=Chryseobacterium flavum TaxID=415851 RepID=UPI002FD94C3A